jgi:sporulation protein YlmC with PRC-barrel domain
MATRLTKLLRREVVSIADGRKLGLPVRIVIDPNQHRIAAVVMTSSAVPELCVYFRPSAVVSFDSDTLAVESLTHLRVAANDEYVLELLGRRRIHERKALSSQGAELGHITDAVFDERGDVLEYRIRRNRLGRFRPRLKIPPDALTAPAGHLAVVDHESVAGDETAASTAAVGTDTSSSTLP